MSMLEVKDLHVSYGAIKAVQGVSFDLNEGEIVALIKPQFEAGREQVGKKGIVRDPDVHKEVIRKVISYGEENGLYTWGATYSPVTGTKGNIEYLLFMKKQKCDNEIDVEEVVKASHEELK